MKKILSLLAVCLLFVGFTSCSDDDNDGYKYEALTKAQRAEQLRDMAGDYTGWVHYNKNDYTSKYDSAAVTATLTAEDSLLSISNLPVRIVTHQLAQDFKNKIDTTGTMPNLDAHLEVYLPYGYVPEDSKLVHWFYYTPNYKNLETTFPVNYDGQLRNMTVTYSTRYNNYASSGAYTGGRLVAQIYINSVALDGVFAKQYINEVLDARLTKK